MGELRIDQVILLTGRRGVGKTTVCQAVAELARRWGYRPDGVITPALYACPEPFDFTQDRRSRRACPADWELGIGNWELTKVGFEAVDVGSGERWPLAHTDPSTGRCGERSPEPCPEPFDFTQDRQGRRDSRRIVEPSGHRRELGGPRVGPYSFDPIALDRALNVLRRAISVGCDLLIVDEIGPLELEQGKGFAPILDLLPVVGPTHTLIVVRPALLDPLLLHLRDIECTIFSVTEENRDELPLQIVEELWGDRHCCAVR